jgi:hypothetical protein
MAVDKNSIIVYADWIELFEALKDDEAGRLIKHFFRYVNDQNPEPPDRLTELSFIPMKTSLKRDLKKWECTKEKRSIAGLASAEARKQAKENQQNLTKSTSVKSVEQNQQEATNSTVSVSVSVSDSVSDINNTDIHKPEKPKIKKPEIPSESEFMNFYQSELSKEFPGLEFSIKTKYETWLDSGWKDGNGNKIGNWKLKLKNTIPHLKAKYDPNKPTQSGPLSFSAKNMHR